MRKRALVILFVALAAMQLSACGSAKKTETEVKTTVESEVTDSEATASEKISVSDSTTSSHVKGDNVEFDTSDGIIVRTSNYDKDGLTYNGFVFCKDDLDMMVAMEGTYPEPITKDNYNEVINRLLRVGYATTTDIDFTSKNSAMKDIGDGCLYTVIPTDGNIIMIKTSSNGEYVISLCPEDNFEAMIGIEYNLGFENYITSETSDSAPETKAELESLGDVRETSGREDEFKEGSGVESSSVETEASERKIISSDSKGYTITLDNEPYTINIPDAWISDVSDHLIITKLPDNDRVNANYSNSYVKVGDIASIEAENKSMEGAAKIKGNFKSIPFKNSEIHVFTMEREGWNSITLYVPISGYSQYLKIYITDHSKNEDFDTLISRFTEFC